MEMRGDECRGGGKYPEPGVAHRVREKIQGSGVAWNDCKSGMIPPHFLDECIGKGLLRYWNILLIFD
jgi:hypothetical protein